VTGDGQDRTLEAIGAQAERTEMAWVRTALASGGLGAVSVRMLGADAVWLALAVGVLVSLPGLVASWWRIRGLRRQPEPAAPRPAGAALVVATVVLVDVLVLFDLLF
jgi:uncharacterized membrane protein YidH (DUF202 family)